mgnify:CR=1 FL=1
MRSMLFAEGIVEGRREVRLKNIESIEKEVNVVGMCGRRESRCAVTAQSAGVLEEDLPQRTVDST